LSGLYVPEVANDEQHAFYMYGMRYTLTSPTRDTLVAALRAEGIPGVCDTYVNIHLYPMYQHKIAYGRQGYPWTAKEARSNIQYQKGICPNAEQLNDEEYIGLSICVYELSQYDIEQIIQAFHKVWRSFSIVEKNLHADDLS
jgi:dTDP-4-amino-4,6-dideoxygalactose transaminase